MNIVWTLPASSDLDNIWNFIVEDSEYYANMFIPEIIFSVDNLEKYPRSGRIVPEFKIENIREIIYRNYRIIYKIIDADKNIFILTVIHGSRKLKKHLKKKNLKNL